MNQSCRIGQLLVLGSGEQRHWLSAITTTSLPALRAYLDGRGALRCGSYGLAIKVFDAAFQLDSQERDRLLWLELALVLAEGTGRRIGSIRRLRWSDIGFDPPAIFWRAESDKRHREQWVPIPESLAMEIRAARARLGAVGDGWVFKQASKDAPWAPAQCQDYLASSNFGSSA